MYKLARQCRQRYQLFFFLIPALIYILVFHYYPMLGVQIAFRDYTPVGGIWGSDWVGLKHFRRFFKSYQFDRVLKNTLSISVYSLLLNFPLAIFMSLCMNTVRNVHYKKLVQTVTYMPHFISTVVLVGMLTQLLNPIMGLYGNVYRLITGSAVYPKDLLSKSGYFQHLYVLSGTWQNLGWNTIIYISALSAVDPELHEAAEIDGANKWQKIWHITIPALIPMITVMLLLSVGNIMKSDTGLFYQVTRNSGVLYPTTQVIDSYVLNAIFRNSNFGFTAATSFFQSVVGLLMMLFANGMVRKIAPENALF